MDILMNLWGQMFAANACESLHLPLRKRKNVIAHKLGSWAGYVMLHSVNALPDMQSYQMSTPSSLQPVHNAARDQRLNRVATTKLSHNDVATIRGKHLAGS